MKYILSYVLAALSLSGCSFITEQAARNMHAEQLYLKAVAILNDSAAANITDSKAKEALGYIDEAIDIRPDETRFQCLKGIACNYLKDYDLAIQSFDFAIDADSTNCRAWMGKGISYTKTSNYNLAIQSFLQAQRYDKHPYKLYFNMGTVYSKLKKDSIALEYYNKCLRMEPGEKGIYMYRASAKQGLGRYTEALTDLNIAISAYPNDLSLYNNRGLCKHYLKQYNEAISDFEKAISIPTTNEQELNIKTYAYNNMANAYFALGKTEEACTYWNKAIENGYKYQPEWKEEYFIDDPVELIKQHCK